MGKVQVEHQCLSSGFRFKLWQLQQQMIQSVCELSNSRWSNAQCAVKTRCDNFSVHTRGVTLPHGLVQLILRSFEISSPSYFTADTVHCTSSLYWCHSATCASVEMDYISCNFTRWNGCQPCCWHLRLRCRQLMESQHLDFHLCLVSNDSLDWFQKKNCHNSQQSDEKNWMQTREKAQRRNRILSCNKVESSRNAMQCVLKHWF